MEVDCVKLVIKVWIHWNNVVYCIQEDAYEISELILFPSLLTAFYNIGLEKMHDLKLVVIG